MSETERLERLKAALQTAMIKADEAEGFLEDAAELSDPVSEKADKIWRLKLRLNALGIEILELSKT